MKNLIALLICMITMMVVMPPGIQASNSQSPGSCFILQVDNFAPAAMLQVEATTSVTQFTNLSICFLADPPGIPITAYCTNKPIIMKLPNFAMSYQLDFLTCFYDVIAGRNLKLQRNKDWVNQVRIRSDSWI